MSNESQQPELHASDLPDTTAQGAETPSVDDQLSAVLGELEKTRQDLLYAKAEVQNAQRRAADEIDKARKFAVEKFAVELLSVKDSLEMALKDTSSIDNIKTGVELTLKQLGSAFDKFQLSEINPLGEKLDPHQHQAVTAVPVPGKEPNTVIDVMQKGYRLADRLIRPALVVVSKSPDA